MIQRTIGPMQIQDLPDPEVTLADYALVMTYTGTAPFDPSVFIASVFERRYDPTIAENGYYWHRIPGSQHDIEEAEGLPAFSTQLTPYPDRITLGGTEFPVGSFATHDWAKMDSTASGHESIGPDVRERSQSTAQADFEDVNASDVTQAFHKDVYRHLEALAKRVYKLENK
jgi:hypothetical protein